MPLITGDNFNSYANGGTLNAAWPGGGGTLFTGSGAQRDASPDASQYSAWGADIEGGFGMPWGTQQNLGTRTFTGFTPGAKYLVKFKMNVGYSNSSGISGFPAAHSFTAGLKANSDRLLIAFNDHVEPQGTREDPGIPGDVTVYQFNDVDFVSEPTMCVAFPQFCGWHDYGLLTTADGSGHITVTIGTWDERFFPAFVYFEDIGIWDTPPAVAPAPGVRRMVLYFCEKNGNRIIAYGDGITQVGDNYQGAVETHDWLPEGETGSVYYRTLVVSLNAVGAHTIAITPIVDGVELAEQEFSGGGTGETVYPVYVNRRGVRIRCRIRTLVRSGPIELENIEVVYVPIRPFPITPAPKV